MSRYRSRRAIAREQLELLKAAYARLDTIDVERPGGWDEYAQATGRYDGLKIGYELLTGRSPQDISREVVHWYIGTPMYDEAKKHYDTRPGGTS